MMDFNQEFLKQIASSSRRISLLLELQEIKALEDYYSDLGSQWKGASNEKRMNECIGASNFLINRRYTIYEELWGGEPVELGRSATTEKKDE